MTMPIAATPYPVFAFWVMESLFIEPLSTPRMSYRLRENPDASMADLLSKTGNLAALSSIRSVRLSQSHTIFQACKFFGNSPRRRSVCLSGAITPSARNLSAKL